MRSTRRALPRRTLAFVAIGLLIVLAVALAPTTPQAATLPPAATGPTALAQDGKVVLAWQPSAGATEYAVYRGTSAGNVTQRLTAPGFAATTYTDTGAANGTTYYYAVRAASSAGESAAGQLAQATPRARSCSTGNAIVVENCVPGSTSWKLTNALRAQAHGIDGFLSASSIDAGQSVDLKVMADWDAPYHVEIYRTGNYGGSQARLVSVIPGLAGNWAPNCAEAPTTTGLLDCAGWPKAATISTTNDWVSGVYLFKLVRDDNATTSETVLVVRDDGNHSDVAYTIPTSTYQAYNRWGGKSLYDGLSNPPKTVSGGNRAVKVSFDRPFAQPWQGSDAHDWYTRADIATVGWLESQGYDLSYLDSHDVHASGAQLRDHKVVISGAHDEYWSQQMFDAMLAARDAGTSLVFLGANASYWKVRFESSAVSGIADRVETGYKTIQSGPSDPSGIPTTTWRDPSGPNRPENELLGQMYVGENLSKNFPLNVSAIEGQNRIWRYTSVASLAAGTTASIGSGIVGWEWDARVANGREPGGVTTVASTPVTGQLIQGNGASTAPGSTLQNSTIYTAASGARVFATGTNNWWRGLGMNVHGEGEPDARLRQATANVLADMGARPSTPSGGVAADPVGPPAVTSTTPAPGTASVQPNASIKAVFDRELDPSSVGAGDVTVVSAGGAPVAGTVSLDNATKTVTLQLDDALEPFTGYTATMGTGVKSWNGDAPAAAYTWSFTTGPGTPPVIVTRTPASGATGAPTDATIKAKFDRKLDPTSVTGAAFSLKTASGTAIPADVSYDDATRTARLVPTQPLAQSTQYTATVTTDIRASDGTAIAAGDVWSFSTGTNLTVTGRTPAPLASGVSPSAIARAVFDRPVDATTLTASSFTLTGPNGQVPATIGYDGVSRSATLTPLSPLTTMTTYTVTVTSGVHGSDGAAMVPVTWTFTTATTAPPAPALTSVTPAGGTSNASNGARVIATFDQPLDPATVTNQSFSLTPDGGQPLTAAVSYDAASGRAILTPAAPLAIGQHYTATLTTAIRSVTGAPLAATTSWGFTTANCPCSLMASLTPTEIGLPVQDYRPGTGPFSYEVGTKIALDQPTKLIALRFWKDPHETGTHVGRVWTAAGQQLASVTFANESASGWQRQVLATPLSLTSGTTYVVSVGLNAYYTKTLGGLATALSSGPLHTVADNANGVYAATAGQFPTNTWQKTNYFVDATVKISSSPARTPAVTSVTPSQGATGVATSAKVKASFNVALDPATVNGTTFTLTDQGGAAVPASVSYDEDAQQAVLTPNAPLTTGTAYTARLSTGVRSDDETAMAAAFAWTFTTVPPSAPQVTAISPSDGTVDVSPVGDVTATFSAPMDASTLTSSNVTLKGPDGTAVPAAISYDGPTRTMTLDPASPLAATTAYTLRIGTGAKSAQGAALAAPVSATFTTSACPCQLFPGAAQVADAHLSVQNGRSGTGPWSLELGVKITVTKPARLEAIRYWRDSQETGTHVGRLWTTGGTLIASTTFSGETDGPSWQEQALATPVSLVPGATYVVSVGQNAFFGMTSGGLASEIVSGPLRSIADGRNGVYGDADGSFPDKTWGSSNYWVDAVVR